jgi:acyl carrier protein
MPGQAWNRRVFFEEKFGFTILDEEADKVVTVEDLYDTVGRLLGRAG